MEEIVKVIRVDTKNSDKSLNQLKKEIKDLKGQLESATVGSADFQAKLEALGKVQKTYSDITLQVAARTQDLEKSFSQVAAFGGSLMKSYSAINAAFGLLGSNSEDLNKALLKTAKMMQLISGLPGIGQAFGQLPKVVANFKDWLGQISPIKNGIDSISQSINGLQGPTLDKLNDIATNGINIDVKAEATSNLEGVEQAINGVSVAAANQERTIVPVNEEWDKYNKRVNELEERQKALKQTIEQENATLESQKKAVESIGGQYDEASKKTAVFEKAINEIEDSIMENGRQQQAQLVKIAQYEEAIKDAQKTYEEASEAAKVYDGAVKDLGKSYNSLVKQQGKTFKIKVNDKEVSMSQEKMAKLLELAQKEVEVQFGPTKSSINQLDEAKAALEAAKKEQAKWAEEASKAKGTLDQLIEAQSIELKELDKLGRQYDVQVDKQDQLKKQMENTQKAYKGTAESIKLNEKELDEVAKDLEANKGALKKIEGELGNGTIAANKLGKALKSLGRSAAWTVAISLAVTALMKLISKVGELIKAQREAAKAQRLLNEELAKGSSSSAKQITAILELKKAYSQLGDSIGAKQKFLEDYRDRLKETGIAINDVNTADKVFIDNTDTYINAVKSRAKADAARQLAAKKYQEYLEKRGVEEVSRDEAQTNLDTNNQRLKTARENGVTGEGLAGISGAINEAQSQLDKADKAINKLDEDINKTVDHLFEVAQAEDAAAAAVLDPLDKAAKAAEEAKKRAEESKKAAVEAGKKAAEERQKELEQLKKWQKEALEQLMDQKTRELQAINDKYKERLELAKKYNEDTTKLEIARQQEIKAVIDKYDDQQLQDAADKTNKQVEELQKAIERIRKMKDTSNLVEPVEKKTRYTQGFSKALDLEGNDDVDKYRDKGTSGSYLVEYETKEQIESNYKLRVEYNNKVLELTQDRVNRENEVLKKQDDELKNGLTNQLALLGFNEEEMSSIKSKGLLERSEKEQQALELFESITDRRGEIANLLAENEIALSNAVAQNDRENTEEYIKLQEKKRSAVNATLEVTSQYFAAAASMAQSAMMDDKKSEAEQKKASKAYATFATMQAVADTYKGANEAYSAMAGIPTVGPALGVAAALAAVTNGLANVRQIMESAASVGLQVSASIGSTASSQVTPPDVPSSPISYTRNLLGDKELDVINEPIKCYVLENEITSKQGRVQVREQNASF